MKVLFLGYEDSPLIDFLRADGNEIVQTMDRIAGTFLDEHSPNFAISYGYRYIVPADLLARVADRAVNLHISHLPWNRGADPNLWSFVDDTPKGVTIHYLDEGVDTGDIIAQKETSWEPNDTLATTYKRLQEEVQTLFRHAWPAICAGTCSRTPQEGRGSSHRRSDRERVQHLLTEGWNTPVKAILEAGSHPLSPPGKSATNTRR